MVARAQSGPKPPHSGGEGLNPGRAERRRPPRRAAYSPLQPVGSSCSPQIRQSGQEDAARRGACIGASGIRKMVLDSDSIGKVRPGAWQSRETFRREPQLARIIAGLEKLWQRDNLCFRVRRALMWQSGAERSPGRESEMLKLLSVSHLTMRQVFTGQLAVNQRDCSLRLAIPGHST